MNPNGDRTTPDQTAQLVVLIKNGAIDRDTILAETYLLAHRIALFTDEFHTVMQQMTSGKMGGIFGRMFGKVDADTEKG
jgi:hypothetical protein